MIALTTKKLIIDENGSLEVISGYPTVRFSLSHNAAEITNFSECSSSLVSDFISQISHLSSALDKSVSVYFNPIWYRQLIIENITSYVNSFDLGLFYRVNEDDTSQVIIEDFLASGYESYSELATSEDRISRQMFIENFVASSSPFLQFFIDYEDERNESCHTILIPLEFYITCESDDLELTDETGIKHGVARQFRSSFSFRRLEGRDLPLDFDALIRGGSLSISECLSLPVESYDLYLTKVESPETPILDTIMHREYFGSTLRESLPSQKVDSIEAFDILGSHPLLTYNLIEEVSEGTQDAFKIDQESDDYFRVTDRLFVRVDLKPSHVKDSPFYSYYLKLHVANLIDFYEDWPHAFGLHDTPFEIPEQTLQSQSISETNLINLAGRLTRHRGGERSIDADMKWKIHDLLTNF